MAPSTDWIKPFRAQVRSVTGSGWFVQEDRHGMVRLKIQGDQWGAQAQTCQLDHPWNKKETGRIIHTVTELYQLMSQQGLTLRAAMQRQSGSRTELGTNWDAAIDAFRDHLTTRSSTIKEVTWKRYAEVLAAVSELMASKTPASSGFEVIAKVTARWKPGARRRQEAVRQVARFLKYCVEHRHFPAGWAPPSDLQELIGVAPAKAKGELGNKTTPLSDLEILQLIESIPDTDAGRKWADAIRLCAELGLRPVELKHLSVAVDAKGQAYFLCSYEKRAGRSSKTAQRRLHSLRLVDGDGKSVEWNLLMRWQAGLLKLPPLDGGNGPADQLRHYLMRRPLWKHLEATYAEQGSNIGTYSLRGAYSLRGHRRGIDAGSMALAMGHSLQVHITSYPWAEQGTTLHAFERARDAEPLNV
jgi:integrase